MGLFLRNLPDELKSLYSEILHSKSAIIVWITTKVVMELLDSCSPAFTHKEAEFFNLLYGPILFYQDWDIEISKESFWTGVWKEPGGS